MDNLDMNKLPHEVVVNNFFKYLEESGKTMKEYAKDNNLDRTILSKWKSGVVLMNVDQVYAAAKYFGKTVNDFYYSDLEKRQLEVLSDKSYTKILAKQQCSIKDLKPLFSHPFKTNKETFIMLFLVLAIFGFLIKFSLYFLILMGLVIILFSSLYYQKWYNDKNAYIINYTDYIYYKAYDNKTINYKLNIILIALAVLFTILNGVLAYFLAEKYDDNIKALLYIIFSYSILNGLIIFATSSEFNTELKSIINDKDLELFLYSYVGLISCIIYLALTIYLIILNSSLYYLIFMPIISLILDYFSFNIITKNYQKYKLIYAEDGKKEIELNSKTI